MYYLDEFKMDPGLIGCDTSNPGSFGKLGNLEPKSNSAFNLNVESPPFKLQETYFTCLSNYQDAMINSIGIVQGSDA